MLDGPPVDPRDRGSHHVTELVNVTIDGTTVQVPKGELLIKAAQEHGRTSHGSVGTSG